MSRAASLQQLREILQQTSVVSRQSAGVESGQRWPPAAGLRLGEVSEWLSGDSGCGAWELAVATMRPLLPLVSRWLVVDLVGELSPAACAGWGIDLTQTVFLNGISATEALWAIEQALRSRGVDVVLAQVDRMSPVTFRRIKLAAESSQARCLLLRSATALKQTSWADLRVQVFPHPTVVWERRRVHVEILKLKHGLSGGQLTLEIDHEANVVRLVPELGYSASLLPAS